MFINKVRVNLIFALVVLALAITAVSTAIKQSKNSSPLAAPDSSGNQLPKDHLRLILEGVGGSRTAECQRSQECGLQDPDRQHLL